MKKILSVFASAVLLSALCLSCNSKKNKSDKLQIVATIYPVYDWVENVLGDKAKDAEVTLLMNKGVDLHNYQPSADDIIKIINSDLFIYVGGESDDWVEDVLSNSSNKDMLVINLLEELGDSAKEEEIIEGMQSDEDHHHHHEDEDDDEHEHEDEEDEHEHHHEEVEYDEHIWLSLKNASLLTEKITEALCAADEKNAEVYKSNFASYKEKLSALDVEYEKAVTEAKNKTLLFADRFPFRYMTEDYGLNYYAAFAGCSAETEASFETVVFLANKVDSLNLSTVLTIEGKKHKIAETVIASTKKKNQKILTMDSLQSAGKNSKDYLSVMQSNLEVLKRALK